MIKSIDCNNRAKHGKGLTMTNLYKRTLKQWYSFETEAENAERDFRYAVEDYEFYKCRYEEYTAEYQKVRESGEKYDIHAWGELLERQKNILNESLNARLAAKAKAKKARRRANIWREAVQSVAQL